ncbi:MAG: V4R domain-containing protein [Opitutaceae bacterium]|nr:V4R domain-containing protein [Opitutaceae bacterium]
MPRLPIPTSTDAAASPAAEVFRTDPAKGGLVFGEERVALLSGEFIRRIHFAIIEAYGDSAQDVLYRSGFEWALQTMLTLNARRPPELGAGNELSQLDPKVVLEAWWMTFARMGWGAASFTPNLGRPGVAHIELEHSAIAEVLGRADDPVCHVYAGLFAGAASFIGRTERHAVEVQCRALGAPSCRFVIGAASDVDAAETMRQQGRPAAEIVEQLR